MVGSKISANDQPSHPGVAFTRLHAFWLILLFSLVCFGGDHALRAAQPRAKEPGETDSDEQVWLADLAETESEVTRGEVGRNGELGIEGRKVQIGGEPQEHSIAAYPHAYVQYHLGGRYGTFAGEVAMDDTAVGDFVAPVVFQVHCDGALVWESQGLYRAGDRQRFEIDIEGADRLTLVTDFLPSISEHQPSEDAYAVWLDPQVSEAPPAPEENRVILRASDYHLIVEAWDRYQRACELLISGSYEELEEMAATLRTSSGNGWDIEGFYRALESIPGSDPDMDWEKYLGMLEEWHEQMPESATALVALASSYVNYGWEARGSGYANTVTEEGWKLLEERLDIAGDYLQQALELDPDLDGFMYATAMSYGLARGFPIPKVEAYLDKGLELHPHMQALYSGIVLMLLPRWYGEPGDIGRMAARIDRRLPEELRAEAHARLFVPYMLYEPGSAADFKNEGFEYQKLRQGFLDIAKRYPAQRDLIDYGCRLACDYNDPEAANRLFQYAGASFCKLSIWYSVECRDAWYRWSQPDHVRDEMQEELYGLHSAVRMVEVSRDGRLVGAITGRDGLVLWDLPHGEIAQRSYSGDTRLYGMTANSDLTQVMVARGTRRPDIVEVNLLDLKREQEQTLTVERPEWGSYYMTFSPDGRWVSWIGTHYQVRLWHLTDPEEPIEIDHRLPRPSDPYRVVFSPDSEQVAISTVGGGVALRDAATGQELNEILRPGDRSLIYATLTFTPDGEQIVAGGRGGEVYLFDIEGKSVVAKSSWPEDEWGGWIICVAVSPDGRLAAAGRINGEIVLVDLPSMEIRHTFHGHTDAVDCLEFSSNGETLVSGSRDQRACVWDLTQLDGNGFAATRD